MQIQEFIDFFSIEYKDFGILSGSILRDHATFLLGFSLALRSDNQKDGSEKMFTIAEDLMDAARLIEMLKSKA